jgi:hypothetical protein
MAPLPRLQHRPANDFRNGNYHSFGKKSSPRVSAFALLKSESWAVPRAGLRAVSEFRRDVRRDRDVVIEDGNVMGDVEKEVRRPGMLRDEARNQRVRGHEARKARMGVVQSRWLCNF